jgi:hypothetical protein
MRTATKGKDEGGRRKDELFLPAVLARLTYGGFFFILHPSAFILASRSLIQRVTSFSVERVKILRFDKVQTCIRHALEQRHDLRVRHGCAFLG